MADELDMKRVMSSLVPSTRRSSELLLDLPTLTPYRVKVWQPRNPKHHRKYWALIDAVFPHQTTYATSRHLHEAIKLSVGHFDMIRTLKGKDVPVTRETKFDKMDQKEFAEFYEKAVTVILERILPGVGRKDLDAQIHEILDGSRVDA